MKAQTLTYPMNSMDKYIWGQENEHVHFNSHFIFTFSDQLDLKRLRIAIAQLMRQIPLCRTVVKQSKYYLKREIRQISFFYQQEILAEVPAWSQTIEDEFCNRPFQLDRQAPLRFLYCQQENKLIFSVHHSAFDGHAHTMLFSELFKLYDGKEISEDAKKIHNFRYRSHYLKKGIGWCSKRVWLFVKPFNRAARPVVGSLLDYPERLDRKVSTVSYTLTQAELDRWQAKANEQGLSRIEFLLFHLFKNMDRMIADKGDKKRDLLFYMPRDLRHTFGLRYIYQNILGMVWVNCKRAEIQAANFANVLKERVKEASTVETSARLAFYSGFFSTMMSPKKLVSYLREADANEKFIFSSFLVSSGRIPPRSYLPKDHDLVSVHARGAMLKSPGIGLIHTGTKETETLTLEYAQALFKPETIEAVKAVVEDLVR